VFSYDVAQNADGSMGDVTMTIDASRPKGLMCKDWFFIGNTDLYHVETITEAGTHTVTFSGLNSDEQADFKFEGLKVYMFCDGYIDTFISAFKTLLCFVGGLTPNPEGGAVMGSHIPAYMEKQNVAFL
jgi:hypothetical protein